MIFIRRLVWDSWNVAHIARHEVTPDEVEEVCHGEHIASQTYDEAFFSSDRLYLIECWWLFLDLQIKQVYITRSQHDQLARKSGTSIKTKIGENT
jgi:hypothetical protein